MDKEIITFGEVGKRKFHHRKNLILLEYVDIENIKACSIVFSGEKNYRCFIGYKHDYYKIKLLWIMLLKTSTYVKSYDGETKWMTFLITDDDLVKKLQ